MARRKKSKLFELFSSDFKVTDFYKPTMDCDDVYYYILIDDVIKLRMRVIDDVVVIDTVETVTTSYIKPIYEKLVKTVMNQSELTVLVSLIGNVFPIQQACMSCNAVVIEDERFITVAQSYYNKIKKKYGDDLTKYGFYLLSVGDTEDISSPGESVSVNHTPIGVEPPISKVSKLLLAELKTDFPKVKTESAATDAVRCYLTDGVEFVVEVVKGDIYIKDLFQPNSASINLVKLMSLISVFEKLITIQPNVYILNVQSMELNRVCTAKGYENIPEERKLPMNNLFKQAFQGYGTYHITI